MKIERVRRKASIRGKLTGLVLASVGIAVVWSGVVALVAMFIVKAIFGGARVSESSESDGLDLSSHGERAYN